MAKTTEADRVKIWQRRVDESCKRYDRWAKKFKVDDLEDYYLGQQWPEDMSQNYVINLFYPTIEVRKPSLYFFEPKFHVRAKPAREDDPGSTMGDRARLREDILNTLASDRGTHFRRATQLALHESHFRFGVVEVGYSADFTENPHVGKPILKDADPLLDENDEPVIDTREFIPENERIFVKRISAMRFRVSLREQEDLENCDWCGYYEWHHVEDLKKSKIYRNAADIKPTGQLRRERPESRYAELEDAEDDYRYMALVWKIWDLRTNRKLVFVNGGEKFLLEEEFDFSPFAVLKHHEELDRFYPMPPCWNWLKPQDELNETREMQRVHRRRAVRRYTYHSGDIDPGEADKLLHGGDLSVAESNVQGEVFFPVADAPLDGSVWRNVPATKEDFMEISGITGEQRGVQEAETATQAQIMETRARTRENFARLEVGYWLAKIGWLMLRTVEERMSEAFPILVSVDPTAEGAEMEAMRVLTVWQQIKATELDPLHYEVDVEIDELSPVSQQTRREEWNHILAIMTNEKLALLLTHSETLLRKTLSFYGIRNDQEVREIRRVMEAMLGILFGMASAAQGGGAGGSPTDTPTNDQMSQQLLSQVGLGPQ